LCYLRQNLLLLQEFAVRVPPLLLLVAPEHRDQSLRPRFDLLDKVSVVQLWAEFLRLLVMVVVLVAVLLLHLVIALKLHPLVEGEQDQMAEVSVIALKLPPLERHHQVMVEVVVVLVCNQTPLL
jgi:hypothetical protein